MEFLLEIMKDLSAFNLMILLSFLSIFRITMEDSLLVLFKILMFQHTHQIARFFRSTSLQIKMS